VVVAFRFKNNILSCIVCFRSVLKCELICNLENVKRRYGLIQQYNINSFRAASDLWKSVYHEIN